MKNKFLAAALVLTVSGCTQLESLTAVDSNASVKEKFRACAVSEAMNKVQDGTAFSLGLSAASDEIVNSCIKKLALQSAGIDSEAESMTNNILSALMKGNSAK